MAIGGQSDHELESRLTIENVGLARMFLFHLLKV
jgi:hypothetical protein